MGHIDQNGLKELEKQGLLKNDKPGDLPFCQDTIFSKATKVNLKIIVHQTKQILDYVHYDLWEPSRVPSHGRARYFLSIIDDYSRKV